jgi:hypothetical protein
VEYAHKTQIFKQQQQVNETKQNAKMSDSGGDNGGGGGGGFDSGGGGGWFGNSDDHHNHNDDHDHSSGRNGKTDCPWWVWALCSGCTCLIGLVVGIVFLTTGIIKESSWTIA